MRGIRRDLFMLIALSSRPVLPPRPRALSLFSSPVAAEPIQRRFTVI